MFLIFLFFSQTTTVHSHYPFFSHLLAAHLLEPTPPASLCEHGVTTILWRPTSGKCKDFDPELEPVRVSSDAVVCHQEPLFGGSGAARGVLGGKVFVVFGCETNSGGGRRHHPSIDAEAHEVECHRRRQQHHHHPSRVDSAGRSSGGGL